MKKLIKFLNTPINITIRFTEMQIALLALAITVLFVLYF